MSEFSQSYHLRTDAQADGVALLERAGLGGWVFPPGNGWVSFVPLPDPYGEPTSELVQANRGTLLFYMNAEDHGWVFTIFEGPQPVSSYGCGWEDDLDVQDEQLDASLVDALVRDGAMDPDLASEQAQRLLHPDGIDQVLTYFTHTEGRNPGHGFAETLGLEHFHELSAAYLQQGGDTMLSGIDGVIRLGEAATP